MDTLPSWSDVISGAIDRRLETFHTAQPGVILEYDDATRTASVQASIPQVEDSETGEQVARFVAPLQGVPVIFPSGGGFEISFPVKAGDLCLLVHTSVSIAAYKTGDGTPMDPGDYSRNHISDAVAFVSPMCGQAKRILQDPSNPGVIVGGVSDGDQRVTVRKTSVELGADASDPVITKTDTDRIISCLTSVDVLAGIASASVDGGSAYETAVEAYFTTNPVPGSSIVKAAR